MASTFTSTTHTPFTAYPTTPSAPHTLTLEDTPSGVRITLSGSSHYGISWTENAACERTVSEVHPRGWIADYVNQLRRYAGRKVSGRPGVWGTLYPSRLTVDGKRFVQLQTYGTDVDTGDTCFTADAVFDLPTIYALADALEALAE